MSKRKPTLKTNAMVRRIRDAHAKLLAGKTREERIAFYRKAGEKAMAEARTTKPVRRRRAS